MSSRLGLNLLLFGLACILGVIVFWEINDSKSENPTLLNIDSRSINRIEIQRKGKTSLVLEKTSGTWMITTPIQEPANSNRVDELLKIAHSKSLVQYTVTPEDLKKFGLNPPKATLILNNKALHFGDVDPLKMRRYGLDGQTLHLVNNNFYHLLIAVPKHYAAAKQTNISAKP